MIINKISSLLIERPEEVFLFSEKQSWGWIEAEENGNLIFVIPNHIIDNHEKDVYKVGYLRKFLKLLYPELSYSKIHKKINSNWEVFKSNRQMERLSKKYDDLF